MAQPNLQAYFLTKSAIRGNKVTVREFTILVGMQLLNRSGGGSSIQAVQRYCESYGWCWSYRNFVRLISKLITAGYIKKHGRQIVLTADAMLLLKYVERKVKKTIAAAA